MTIGNFLYNLYTSLIIDSDGFDVYTQTHPLITDIEVGIERSFLTSLTNDRAKVNNE